MELINGLVHFAGGYDKEENEARECDFETLKGGYDKEEKVTREYDLPALKYGGLVTTTNFLV